MRDSIKQARDVIIATDDDREGEAIGWTICQFCHLDVNKTKKLRLKSTRSALMDALNNIQYVNMDRVKVNKLDKSWTFISVTN